MKRSVTTEDIELIDKLIMDNFEQHKSETDWIVQDGIIDLDSYNKAKYRILWILREVPDIRKGDNKDAYGDWDYRKFIQRLISNKEPLGLSSKTLSPIILTSFGILKDMKWDGMDDIPEHNYKIVEVLKQIAYINLKKQPGKTKSISNEIRDHYLRDEAVILKQVETIDPDIIICGGTLNDYLIKGLKLQEKNARPIGYLKCYLQDGRIYIRASHPSSPGNKTEYVDEIINAIRIWESINIEL